VRQHGSTTTLFESHLEARRAAHNAWLAGIRNWSDQIAHCLNDRMIASIT
jgi:hypothetical protein